MEGAVKAAPEGSSADPSLPRLAPNTLDPRWFLARPQSSQAAAPSQGTDPGARTSVVTTSVSSWAQEPVEGEGAGRWADSRVNWFTVIFTFSEIMACISFL